MKIQCPLVTTILSKLGKKGNFLNLVKSNHKKLTANITLNGERLNILSLSLEKKANMSALMTLIKADARRSSLCNTARKRNKRTTDSKNIKARNWPICTDNMLVHVEILRHF